MRTVGRCRSLFTICEVTDSTRCAGSRRACQPRLRASSAVADLLGARAQRRDRRDDVERRLPLVELLRLGGDDRLGALGLARRPESVSVDDRLEVVDVVEVAAVELVDRGVEVARDGEVDEQERAALARTKRRARRPRARARARRARRRRRRRPRARAPSRPRRATALARRASAPAPRRARACGSRRARSRRRACARLRAACSLILPAPTSRIDAALRGRRRPAPRARPPPTRPRPGSRRSPSRSAHLAAGVQRLAEEPVEQRPGRADLVRGPHLAEDLALAGNERVEPGGDAEEMERGGLVAQPVERRLELVGPSAGERASASTASLAPRRLARRRRARCGCTSRGTTASPPVRASRARARGRVAVERDALAQLDRRVVVRDADETSLIRRSGSAGGRAGRRRRARSRRGEVARRGGRASRLVPQHEEYAQTDQVTSVTAIERVERRRAARRASPTAMPSVSAAARPSDGPRREPVERASDGTRTRRTSRSRRFSRRSCQR